MQPFAHTATNGRFPRFSSNCVWCSKRTSFLFRSGQERPSAVISQVIYRCVAATVKQSVTDLSAIIRQWLAPAKLSVHNCPGSTHAFKPMGAGDLYLFHPGIFDKECLSVSITRRRFITTSTSILATPFLSSAGYGLTDKSLWQIGASRGIDIGSALAPHVLSQVESKTKSWKKHKKYLQLLTEHVRVITPESGMKPGDIAPDKGENPDDPEKWKFEKAKLIFDFAIGNDQDFVGHTLYWSDKPLEWALHTEFEDVKASIGLFIRVVMNRFPNVKYWDVLNEILGDNGGFADNSVLLQRFGLKFVDFCFRVAHDVDPKAILILNEKGLSCSSKYCPPRRKEMLYILGQLKLKKTPVHAMGLQSHLWPDMPPSGWVGAPPSGAQTAEFISEVAKLGFDSHVSELDVNDSRILLSKEQRDEAVAAVYKDYLTAVLKEKSVKRITFWNIADGYSFINNVEYTWESLPPKYGKPRPLLFDEDFTPKAAFYAVIRAIESK